MGVSVGDLDPRQIERLRGELLLLLVTQCAYPPFFDYRAGKRRQRPPDRATVDETHQFLSSATFVPLHNADVTAPDVRRFLERLILRYIEVNPHLHSPHAQRRVPELRARVPRLAAEMQRALVAYVQGSFGDFGARRPQASWQQTSSKARPISADALAHHTRLLEAALTRSADTARQAIARSFPGAGTVRPAVKMGQSGIYSDATVAVRAPDLASRARAPYADLGSGRQSAIFGRGVADAPTGPLRVAPRPAAPAPSSAAHAPHPAAGPVSDDLYRLYGDYLRDMQPEATAPTPVAVRGAPAAAPMSSPGINSRPGMSGAAAAAATGPAAADLNIFFQLRYQLEAYVRRAVRSYGVQQPNDDPYALLDALRRSGFVDEADLRIAEGILALADRVTSAHSASLEDYRQAMTLYLLYHRSHLGD
ncbi:MAG TPA: hypothetical protein VF116_10760 [Ktedonobacterales bacterium]